MKIFKEQRGVSLIAAIFIILILAFMGVIFVILIGTSSLTGVNEMQATQALFVAEGGLERAVRFLDSPLLTGPMDTRGSCGDVNAALANIALGPGQFTVTANAAFSPANPVTFSNIVGTTINVTGDPIAEGYAPSGRIMIDRELIDYSGLTTSSFTGVVRGRDGTAVSAHANGARIGQYQCTVTSQGGIPTVAAPTAMRTVREGVQLQEGWTVGGGGLPVENLNSVYCTAANNCWAVGDNGASIRWNGVGWSQVISPTTQNLNEVHCFDANNCSAVGNAGGTNAEQPLFLRWDGAAWTQYDSSLININVDLNSVYCPGGNDCWAVGNSVAGGEIIFRWNGAVWSRVGPSGAISNRDLNSVSCVDANNCWAVGDAGGVNERPWILQWNGAWNTSNSNAVDTNLNSVDCVPTGDCWAVGNQQAGEVMLRWNGAAWSRVGPSGPISDRNLSSVSCVDANNCWAVGDAGGAGERPWILRYFGGAWNTYNTAAINVNVNLNSVTCSGANDCWAVGDGGNVFHWDGAAWLQWQQANATVLRWNNTAWNDVSGVLPVGINELRSVSMLSYADGWAIGLRIGGNATIVRWNGTGWIAQPPAPAVNRDLQSIYAVSSADAWAAGTAGTILRWNGAAWGAVAAATGNNLNGISMLDTDNNGAADAGFAVGQGGVIVSWNGANWNAAASPTGQNLNDVFMVSGADGWIVGNRAGAGNNQWTIGRWNGAAWNATAVTTGVAAQHLQSVFCNSAADCWAVGNRQGCANPGLTVLRWNGAAWACSAGLPVIDTNLTGVFAVSANDAWAVGEGGLLLHWDGSAWSQVAPPTGQNLNSVYIIGPRQRPQAAWQEVVQ